MRAAALQLLSIQIPHRSREDWCTKPATVNTLAWRAQVWSRRRTSGPQKHIAQLGAAAAVNAPCGACSSCMLDGGSAVRQKAARSLQHRAECLADANSGFRTCRMLCGSAVPQDARRQGRKGEPLSVIEVLHCAPAALCKANQTTSPLPTNGR